ncbi:MAG: ATP-binding protein [Spirochaetia bacterium]|nr:ATP-binding protein [Spirochaetia bacterium]
MPGPIHLVLKSNISELDRMREAADAFIGNALDEIEKNRVILALDEAFVNIVQHGYGEGEHPPVDLYIEGKSGGIEFNFQDRAPQFDPTATPSDIDLRKHGESGDDHGLGIHLYSTIMKTTYSPRDGGGNSLILFKAIRS